ncbi:hypothetical protein FRC07_004591 [Ceratobasidium sp. 392]|nr:hypothetical protein FRC07_004591 [Ceratobasidium sp. 392]
MIVGAGTGGLIAILLGRLGMSVDEAIETYQHILIKAFSEKKILSGDAVFKATNMESAINRVVARCTGDANTLMLNSDPKGCKTFVCTALAHNMTAGIPVLIRTYEAVENEGPRCTIREAARATSATTGLFKPVTIIDRGLELSYMDAGLGNNNPTACMLAEVERIFPNQRVSLIISIGSGHLSPIGSSQSADAAALGMHVSMDSERVAQEMARRFQNTANLYFRFNVEQGLQHIGLTSWEKMPEVTAHTRKYIQMTEIDQRLARAVHAFSNDSGAVPTSRLSGNVILTDNTQSLKECPPPSPAFTGRESILHQMCDSIFDGSLKRHVFVLYGLGGAGKTQLALKFVEMYKERFSDVFYIDATSGMTIQAGLKGVALAKKIGTTSDDAITWLTACHGNWLIVYNNADDTTLGIQGFFPPCSHGNILITTRNRQVISHAQGTEAHCQVSGMLMADAKQLLLKTSRASPDPNTESVAEAIVKELGYLALAIVQAGAYICVHQCTLPDYLTMYREHRAELLEEYRSLVQKIDDYEWTVYTTWRVSYQKLHPDAILLLQLLAFMHHEGISEDIFRRANVKLMSLDPGPLLMDRKNALDSLFVDFMRGFKSSNNTWYRPAFLKTINEARSYSLIEFDAASGTYSIHPLVQSWIRTTIDDTAAAAERTTLLLALSIGRNFGSQDHAFRVTLAPHIDALPPDLKCQPNYAREFSLAYSDSGHWQMAEKLQTLVVKTDEKILGDNHLTTLTDMHELGMMYQNTGRFGEAEALQTRVVAARTRLLGDSHHETIRALAYLSITYHWQCRYDEAETIQLKVVDQARQQLGAEDRETLMAMQALATTYQKQDRLLEAKDMLEEVLSIQERTLGSNHPSTLISQSNLSSVYITLGQLQRAEKLAAQALDSYLETFGKSHPETLSGVNLLAVIYLEQGRIQEAEKLYSETLEVQRQSLGIKHVQTLSTAGNLGCAYLALGRLSEAEMLLQEVYETRLQVLSRGHSDVLSSVINLSAVYDRQNRLAEAEALMLEELNFRSKVSNKELASTATLMHNLAGIYGRQSRLKEAISLEKEVVRIRMGILGPEHNYTVSSAQFLADITQRYKKDRYLKFMYPTLAIFVIILAIAMFHK